MTSPKASRKPGRASEIPPPLEFECLRALWSIGEGTVKDIREALAGRRALAYTTVLTIMDRLARRGAVERRKQGRAFVYVPRLDREQARKLAVEELIAAHFGGSAEALRAYLGGSREEARPAQAAVEPSIDTTLL